MKLALAGDTMLGRAVAEALASRPSETLVAPDVASLAREADLFLLTSNAASRSEATRGPIPGGRSASARLLGQPSCSYTSASTA